MSGHKKWWRTRARPIMVEALLPHLSVHESRQAADEILDVLERRGLEIRAPATAGEPSDDGTENDD